MRKAVLKFIDFFHPPFSRWIPIHTFRYIASGGTTAASGIVVYYIVYNFILKQQHVVLPFPPGMITAPVAALIIESFISFLIGFTLNKYLVFTQSQLKGRVQLFRYATVVLTNIMLNFAMLKVMVETFHFYPTIAKIIATVILAVSSYFIQTHFSFKVKK